MACLAGSGYYMYMETSGINENNTADLVSPFLPPSQDFCLRLFTNMYGSSIADITILTEVICNII